MNNEEQEQEDVSATVGSLEVDSECYKDSAVAVKDKDPAQSSLLPRSEAWKQQSCLADAAETQLHDNLMGVPSQQILSDDAQPQPNLPKDVQPQQISPDDVNPQQILSVDVQPQQISANDFQPQQILPDKDQPQVVSADDDLQPSEFSADDVLPEEFSPDDVGPQQISPNDAKPQEFLADDVQVSPENVPSQPPPLYEQNGHWEPPPLTDVSPVRPTLDQLREALLPPVVLVHGLLGFGPDEMLTPKGRLHYWETAVDRETDQHGLLVLEATVGPVSSQHDRACELFAQIVGCRTDYGADHCATHKHERYGRDFTGRPLFPWWSAARPVHMVGHSAGGNTIRLLQLLLAFDYWNRGTSAAWIRSVTCIAAPLNGSTATYLLGCNLSSGLFGLSSLVPMVSIVDSLGALVGFPRAERRRMLLWKLEHFGIQQADFAEFNRLRQRMSESDFLVGRDNLAYDLTLQSCDHLNELVRDCPDTYYFSYTCACASSTQVKTFMAAPFLYMRNRNFARGRMGTAPAEPPPGWQWHPDWRTNDGLVPLASQMAPTGQPRESGGSIIAAVEAGCGFRPGVWYSESAAAAARSATRNWDHCDVICARGLLWEGILDRIPLLSNGAQALFNLGKQLGSLRRERSSFSRVSKAEQRRFYEFVYARLSSLG